MLILPAELTHEQAVACCRMLVQGMKSEAESAAVIADAGALLKFDSSALAVLLDCRREALALGKTFSIARLPPRLHELAKLYGVADLLLPAPSLFSASTESAGLGR